MRKIIGIAFALLAPGVFGQAAPSSTEAPTQAASTQARMQDGVLIFKQVQTNQQLQEIANLIRTIMEIKDVTVNTDQMSVTVHGTAEQVTVAGWLAKKLDQPLDVPSATPAAPEFKGVTGDDGKGHAVPDADVVRVLYLPHTATVQAFQEIANATRTVTEMRRVFTYNAGRAMAVRDTPDKVAMAEWIAGELDRASDPQTQKQAAFSGYSGYNTGGNDGVRIFYVSNAKSVQEFQEIANAMRTTAEIRRVFTYNPAQAVVTRGTTDELAMAQWLLTELDKPAAASANTPEYRVPGAADDIVRVYHLTNTPSVQAFQEEATAVRSVAGIRRAFTVNERRALTLRGTVNELALAENLMRDLSAPAARQ